MSERLDVYIIYIEEDALPRLRVHVFRLALRRFSVPLLFVSARRFFLKRKPLGRYPQRVFSAGLVAQGELGFQNPGLLALGAQAGTLLVIFHGCVFKDYRILNTCQALM